jgi:hypothetical protein
VVEREEKIRKEMMTGRKGGKGIRLESNKGKGEQRIEQKQQLPSQPWRESPCHHRCRDLEPRERPSMPRTPPTSTLKITDFCQFW